MNFSLLHGLRRRGDGTSFLAYCYSWLSLFLSAISQEENESNELGSFLTAHSARCRVRLFCALYDAIFAAVGAKGGWKRGLRVGADPCVCPPSPSKTGTTQAADKPPKQRADTGVCPYNWEPRPLKTRADTGVCPYTQKKQCFTTLKHCLSPSKGQQFQSVKST